MGSAVTRRSVSLRAARRGVSVLVYGLTVGLVAVVALAAVQRVGSSGNTLFSTVSEGIAGVAGPGVTASQAPAAPGPAALSLDQSPGTSFTIDAGGQGSGTTVTSSTRTFTVTNSGGTAATGVSVSLSSTTSFSRSGGTCATGTPLAPGASCSVGIQASASGNGSLTGSTITVTPLPSGSAASMSVSGTASNFSAFTYAWAVGSYGGCSGGSPPSWGGWSGCSASCGGGSQTRTCNSGSSGTQTAPVFCRRSDGTNMGDTSAYPGCEAGSRPSGTQSCSVGGGSCSPGQQESTSCNTQACVSCPQVTLTHSIGGGVTCTGTLPASTAGERPGSYCQAGFGAPCGATVTRGGGCAYPGSDTTGYRGTVSGGPYGTCQNYCAVFSTCQANGTWGPTSYTW